jgi:NAD+ synthase (glutamine-hydrolysing)
MTQLIIAIAQLNFTTLDITGNSEKMIAAAKHARDHLKADVIVFSELAITGYALDDLLYHQEIYTASLQAITHIAQETQGIDVIVGYPEATGDVSGNLAATRFNSLAYCRDGKIMANYRKQQLPNYSIFDEKRYFTPGHTPTIVEIKGYKVGLIICEDIWFPEPMKQAKAAGAEIIVCPNASPFATGKMERRLTALKHRSEENKLPIIYINQVGGNDELLFDGRSMAINSQGKISHLLPHCEEAVQLVTIDRINHHCDFISPNKDSAHHVSDQTPEQLIYEALVLGTRDYVHKSGFKNVLIGLSGGIDSAITLAIAVDAFGKENVTGVLMPSEYTSQLSMDLALEQTDLLGVSHHIISITPAFHALLTSLKEPLNDTMRDLTQQNLQSRVRGVLLMALSNETGKMVLTTGNKSETAVGYTTLYGDTAGGYDVLKDVYKTVVYRLAHYRNTISPVIPQAVIDRAPTAELAPNQTDQDSLPPYEILDAILELHIEKLTSIDDIIKAGFDPETVHKVVELIYKNKYKRRQSPPGTRVTPRAFGKDWRYPIAAKYFNHKNQYRTSIGE